MNYWLVVTYKTNEFSRLKENLNNQNFLYYVPKITIKRLNSSSKEEFLFPGYAFVRTELKNYSALKFTRGIKKIISFGNNISTISEKEIQNIKQIEKESKTKPILLKVSVGQDIFISKGSFAGSFVQICSLPSKDRINVFLNILGSKREIEIPITDVSL